MKADLLMKLADIMETRPDASYDQGSWFKNETLDWLSEDKGFVFEPFDQGWRGARVVVKEGACGSAACVLGTACLEMSEETGLSFITGPLRELAETGVRYASALVPSFDDGAKLHKEWRAGAAAFDIPIEHSFILFGSKYDIPTIMFYCDVDRCEAWQIANQELFNVLVTPKLVAKRLREYVLNGGYIDKEAVDTAREDFDL